MAFNPGVYEAVNKLMAIPKPKYPHKYKNVELHVKLKNYTPDKHAYFHGSIRLNHPIHTKCNVCVLGDELHCAEAIENGLHCIKANTIFKPRKTFEYYMKKIIMTYDAFLISDSLCAQMPSKMALHFFRANKIPQQLSHDKPMKQKIEELKYTIDFKLIDSRKLCFVIGNLRLTPEELNDNIITAIRFLVPLLKDKWNNVKNVYIKTPKGEPHLVF
ncbi:large ribosomal subunit protein uL1-like [Drosophila sulfurigaster albostrigata]|uniref:large ribosomal subunit protein uL1-like n=1 Tax=Drosophila sulfurigaster albostrigata TaxID=89887 RepID=UPI002D21D119|nr:large ribosomal subunit protein uL1-like [Drosophila sulfurigaster albostrigata]